MSPITGCKVQRYNLDVLVHGTAIFRCLVSFRVSARLYSIPRRWWRSFGPLGRFALLILPDGILCNSFSTSPIWSIRNADKASCGWATTYRIPSPDPSASFADPGSLLQQMMLATSLRVDVGVLKVGGSGDILGSNLKIAHLVDIKQDLFCLPSLLHSTSRSPPISNHGYPRSAHILPPLHDARSCGWRIETPDRSNDAKVPGRNNPCGRNSFQKEMRSQQKKCLFWCWWKFN